MVDYRPYDGHTIRRTTIGKALLARDKIEKGISLNLDIVERKYNVLPNTIDSPSCII